MICQGSGFNSRRLHHFHSEVPGFLPKAATGVRMRLLGRMRLDFR